MGFLYGNTINHLPLTKFNIAETFPNRKTMQERIEEADEIAPIIEIGKYVLVDYSLADNDSVEENNIYVNNWKIDSEKYCINYTENIPLQQEGNFDLTVWQVQSIVIGEGANKRDAVKVVAIARLHSILPTFESIGKYNIDILEPISDADFFGRGKNIWAIDDTTFLPVSRKFYSIPSEISSDIIINRIKEEYKNATVIVPFLNTDIEDENKLDYEVHIYNVTEVNELDALIAEIIKENT